ncbi:MAG: hypothetical protein SWK90_02605 [Chloroflexota bacterium]|nr:hypothetical protein [Chloroflexota bacterium]
MALEEATDAAPFVFLVPTALPDDLELLPYVVLLQVQEGYSDGRLSHDEFLLIYRGKPGRYVILSESMLPKGPGLAARLADVGGRQGWLESDLIDSHQFVLYLPDWGVAEHYIGRGIPEEADDKLPPGSVILRVSGLSVDEAIAVLESLEPYTP